MEVVSSMEICGNNGMAGKFIKTDHHTKAKPTVEDLVGIAPSPLAMSRNTRLNVMY